MINQMQDCDSSIIGFSVEGALRILIMLRFNQNRTEYKSTFGDGKEVRETTLFHSGDLSLSHLGDFDIN